MDSLRACCGFLAHGLEICFESGQNGVRWQMGMRGVEFANMFDLLANGSEYWELANHGLFY